MNADKNIIIGEYAYCVKGGVEDVCVSVARWGGTGRGGKTL